ncbi:hypothetical protein H2199_003858 [Coniosporium tulheliwenetii]|uniref:Uncharacterized protein n=1 Tax=Coniosporium tulheliwenetii TaxID=3383036 RepID=A0ACC2Z8C3_9PEZI|nr:hypothetical protein H2199_003858 [Cladosporium sp. JES 115]
MSSNILPTTIAGAIFGASLASSGVFLPSVIVSQMQLTSFHMLKVFMAASASSALIMALFSRASLSQNRPHSPSSLGWFGTYDGNIIGGMLMGFGMALTSACPGTMLVQLVTGVRSGWAVMAGGLLGGILYSRLSGSFRGSRPTTAVDVDKLTIHSKLSIDTRYAILAYEVMCLAVITLVTKFGPKSPFTLPYPLVGES